MGRTLHFEATVMLSMATLHRLWQARKWSLLGVCDLIAGKDEVK